jgi:hypothetical protein
METASDVIRVAGGAKTVGYLFGVQAKAVVKYARLGKLPSAWFDGLEDQTGQELPRYLFTFKPVRP